MGIGYNPKIVMDGLQLCFDPGNVKSYPGSGNVYYDLSKNGHDITATTLTVTSDDVAGDVIDSETSSQLLATMATPVDHESWTLSWWMRDTGTPISNYRTFIRLHDTNNIYFYAVDERTTDNSYVIGYQKDYNINSWLSHNFTSTPQWGTGDWFHFAVSHNSGVFKHYRDGTLLGTDTQTRDVASYTDIKYVYMAYYNNTLLFGPFMFYEGVLTDEQIKMNFDAHRGRFGI